jgi:acetyltransferase-like isoleucine patch superfamily enzyme
MTTTGAAHTGQQDVVLVGGRVIGRTLLDRLEADPRWRVVCIIDDGLGVKELRGTPVCSFESYKDNCRSAILALGNPEDKRFYRQKALSIGLNFVTYIDSMAVVGGSCRIGDGSVILPFATVIDGAEIGEHVYLSVYSGVGKGARVGDYTTLMNYSSVRAANLGHDVVLSGAVHILDGAHVGDGSLVAPGTILRRPVPAGRFVWGQPLRARHRPRKVSATSALSS